MARAERSQPLQNKKPFDIQGRTFRFGVAIIRFVRTFPRTLDTNEVGRQLIRAGTSVGANMEEADGAESRRDFVHKVKIARKEGRESRCRLRVCLAVELGDQDQAQPLLHEGEEIVRILSGIISSAESKL
jgi:four helix bundle protein